MVQEQTSDALVALVDLALQQTGSSNVCVVGGYALNCVANFKLREHLPSAAQLYVEPIADDSGNSIGAAKLLHHSLTADATVKSAATSRSQGPRQTFQPFGARQPMRATSRVC